LSSNISAILQVFTCEQAFFIKDRNQEQTTVSTYDLKNLAIPGIIKLKQVGFAVLIVAGMNRYIFQDIIPEKFKIKQIYYQHY
jgi:hypothetical protein